MTDREKLRNAINLVRNTLIDTATGYGCALMTLMDVAERSLEPVEEITAEQISADIQSWRFDDSHDGPFGKFLMEKYPRGIKIIADEKS